jgi:hypothetical protein
VSSSSGIADAVSTCADAVGGVIVGGGAAGGTAGIDGRSAAPVVRGASPDAASWTEAETGKGLAVGLASASTAPEAPLHFRGLPLLPWRERGSFLLDRRIGLSNLPRLCRFGQLIGLGRTLLRHRDTAERYRLLRLQYLCLSRLGRPWLHRAPPVASP